MQEYLPEYDNAINLQGNKGDIKFKLNIKGDIWKQNLKQCGKV